LHHDRSAFQRDCDPNNNNNNNNNYSNSSNTALPPRNSADNSNIPDHPTKRIRTDRPNDNDLDPRNNNGTATNNNNNSTPMSGIMTGSPVLSLHPSGRGVPDPKNKIKSNDRTCFRTQHTCRYNRS
jgi:hypothetical protein